MKNKILLSISILFTSLSAFAEEGAEVAEAATAAAAKGDMVFLGACIALGIAVIGGGIGQGLIGSSAMEGISRNPQAQKNMFTPMILGLVFIETLVLFTFALGFIAMG